MSLICKDENYFSKNLEVRISSIMKHKMGQKPNKSQIHFLFWFFESVCLKLRFCENVIPISKSEHAVIPEDAGLWKKTLLGFWGSHHIFQSP